MVTLKHASSSEKLATPRPSDTNRSPPSMPDRTPAGPDTLSCLISLFLQEVDDNGPMRRILE